MRMEKAAQSIRRLNEACRTGDGIAAFLKGQVDVSCAVLVQELQSLGFGYL